VYGRQVLHPAAEDDAGLAKKSTMPILSHVLLEATKAAQLHVSATDLDISVAFEHPREVTSMR